MPTVGQPVPGYYYDQFTDTLRPITGGPGPKGDPGNANVTVSPNAPTTSGKAGDLWVQTTTTPWTAPANMPWGIIAWKQPNAGSVSLTTTPTEAMRLSSVALVTGRLYAFNGEFRAFSASTATTSVNFDSGGPLAGTTLNMVMNALGASGGLNAVSWRALFTANTGTYTIIVRASVSAGTGALYTEFNSGLSVEDIGPNRGLQ